MQWLWEGHVERGARLTKDEETPEDGLRDAFVEVLLEHERERQADGARQQGEAEDVCPEDIRVGDYPVEGSEHAAQEELSSR